MSSTVLQDIMGQPEALRAVLAHQFGLGKPALLRVAALLKKSERIVFSGMGGSLAACIPSQYAFSEHGISASVFEASELLYFLSGSLRAKTTAVLVSRSGESVEITKLLPILRERGCAVIGVVNVPGSTLAKCADETIVMNSPADGLIAIQTYTATVAVLGLLSAACFGQLEPAKADLERVIEAVERLVKGSAFDVKEDLHFERRPVYLLGRGASGAAVQAGVLLMHEMARLPAVGMSSAQFRHGPVEVVKKHFQAIVFGSQDATEGIDYQFAEDLRNLGACVGWIGRAHAGGEVPALGWWPEAVPARFAPILEIVPVQLLALRLAEAGGIQPGEFRFAAAVTLSETGFAHGHESAI